MLLLTIGAGGLVGSVKLNGPTGAEVQPVSVTVMLVYSAALRFGITNWPAPVVIIDNGPTGEPLRK